MPASKERCRMKPNLLLAVAIVAMFVVCVAAATAGRLP